MLEILKKFDLQFVLECFLKYFSRDSRGDTCLKSSVQLPNFPRVAAMAL